MQGRRDYMSHTHIHTLSLTHTHSHTHTHTGVWVYAMQGRRDYMEDDFEFRVQTGGGTSLFGMYDGHGGAKVRDPPLAHKKQRPPRTLQ